MIGEEVTDHYHAVERLLDRSQQHRRRLLAIAGRFAGLMSWLAFDTHRPALAHDYLDVGIEAAEQATDQRLAVYLAASRNRIATLTDDHASILAAGQEARARAQGRPHGRLTAWIFAIEGRGLAGLGRLREADPARAKTRATILLDSARAAIQQRDHEQGRALLDQACSIDRPALVATHAQRVNLIERSLAASGAG